MQNTLLIKDAHIIDPRAGIDCVGDILIDGAKIIQSGGKIDPRDHPKAELIEADGMYALPGFVDMHVHFRDPGQTHKEDLASGAAAAAAGGFTAVLCMPNTIPPCDSPEILSDILERSKNLPVRIYQTACLSVGMAGEQLCDYKALKKAGAAGLTDDGRPLASDKLMEQAMLKAAEVGLPVISHCEDLEIVAGGIMHEGEVSRGLSVPGIDRRSEDEITAREIALCAKTGRAVHIAHVSTKGSMELVAKAKADGLPVTCETAPHYLLLTHEMLSGRDADYRMNPPLREESDRLAMLEGVATGMVDALITDHAPHAPEEKADFAKAPNGVVGLETAFAANYTALVKSGKITLGRLAELMSSGPAGLMGITAPSLASGSVADLVLVDTAKQWAVDPKKLHSKSKNTPFKDQTLTGSVCYTILDGRVSYKAD